MSPSDRIPRQFPINTNSSSAMSVNKLSIPYRRQTNDLWKHLLDRHPQLTRECSHFLLESGLLNMDSTIHTSAFKDAACGSAKLSSVVSLQADYDGNKNGDVAQLVERRTGTPLTQVRSPGVARDFSPRVHFQCRLSYVCPYTPVCSRMY